MSYFPLQPRYYVFTDTGGSQLENGYIWIGDANKDPKLFPAKAAWDQEGRYAIEFPIRTEHGYPLRGEYPNPIYLNLEDNYQYSVLITEEDGTTVYSDATGLAGYFPIEAADAATLGGELPSYYATDSLVVHLAGAETVTGAKTFNADITLGTGAQIDFFDEVGDKIYLYQNAFGIGIEADSLTNWSSLNFRWRTGGTSVSTGTEVMVLTSTGNLYVDGQVIINNAKIGDSIIRFYDVTNATSRSLFWDDSASGWYVEDSTGTNRALYHAGINPSLGAGNGISGTIDTTATQTITVTNGIITAIA